MNRETAERELLAVNQEAAFNRTLKKIFDSPEGIELFEWLLSRGNFGGQIQGDYACGRHDVSSEVWAAVLKASPNTVKSYIDRQYDMVLNHRSEAIKTYEQAIKEANNE